MHTEAATWTCRDTYTEQKTDQTMSSDTHRYVALNNICVQDIDRHTNTYTRTQIHSKQTDTHTGTCSNTSHKHTYSQPGVEGVGLGIRAEYLSV